MICIVYMFILYFIFIFITITIITIIIILLIFNINQMFHKYQYLTINIPCINILFPHIYTYYLLFYFIINIDIIICICICLLLIFRYYCTLLFIQIYIVYVTCVTTKQQFTFIWLNIIKIIKTSTYSIILIFINFNIILNNICIILPYSYSIYISINSCNNKYYCFIY